MRVPLAASTARSVLRAPSPTLRLKQPCKTPITPSRPPSASSSVAKRCRRPAATSGSPRPDDQSARGGVSREGDETSQPQPDAARTASSPDNTGAEATAPAEDWRAFRARLVQREMQDCGQAAEQSTNEQEPVTTTALQQSSEVQWAHALSNPERGCLLVSRLTDLNTFTHGVVLVLKHDDRMGSEGLLLNIITPVKVSDVDAQHSGIKVVFGDHRLYYGGPLQNDRLHALHSHSDLVDAVEVLPGLYCGGLPDAVEATLAGKHTADSFRLFSGTSHWGAYQLQSELLKGDWYCLSVSTSVILDAISGGNKTEESPVEVRDRLWYQLLNLADIKVIPGLEPSQ
mmetsp:Transcript_6848/g.19903  ORF Transcript_6848/g.19903 Transcript_6848/m.19903 type:complete len:343 (-) Transcript_6848:1006-2034(-)